MSGILAIIVPILNAGATGGPSDPWEQFIFNDDEAQVTFTSPVTSGTGDTFNLARAPQVF
jgi:hypothetical protein